MRAGHAIGVQPRSCCRTLSIFHGGMPSSAASASGLLARAAVPTRPSVRTPRASALVISTGDGAGRQRPAQLLERLGQLPLEARSATLNPVASARPRQYRATTGCVDHPGGVGGQLVARRRQLAQVVADRVEQRAQAAVVGLPARPAELGAQEIHPLAEPLDRRAVDPPGPAAGQAVSSALFLAPPEWVTTRVTSGGGLRRLAGQLGRDGLAGVLRGPDDDHGSRRRTATAR